MHGFLSDETPFRVAFELPSLVFLQCATCLVLLEMSHPNQRNRQLPDKISTRVPQNVFLFVLFLK